MCYPPVAWGGGSIFGFYRHVAWFPPGMYQFIHIYFSWTGDLC
jgi:hypothetical protein